MFETYRSRRAGWPVDGALASYRIAAVVLGHVWRDVQRAQLGHMVGGGIGFVLADRNAATAFLGPCLENVFLSTPLGRSRGMRGPTIASSVKNSEATDFSGQSIPGKYAILQESRDLTTAFVRF